jgi:SET domain-containing protein
MKSQLHGFGCFATVHFLKGSYIANYAGERITRIEAMARMSRPCGKRISELDCEWFIDGSVDGNETQFINHSCEPNADALVIEGFLIVYALREIAPGEEITVDYLNSFEHDRSICRCRATSCRQRSSQAVA